MVIHLTNANTYRRHIGTPLKIVVTGPQNFLVFIFRTFRHYYFILSRFVQVGTFIFWLDYTSILTEDNNVKRKLNRKWLIFNQPSLG